MLKEEEIKEKNSVKNRRNKNVMYNHYCKINKREIIIIIRG